MTWENIVKFNLPKKEGGEKKPKKFKGFTSRKDAKDTMKDFDISTFPKDACSSWQPMGRGCHNLAEWACTTCGAQWCDEHRFSGMDGHTNQVYIGKDPSKKGKRLDRSDKRKWDEEQKKKGDK